MQDFPAHNFIFAVHGVAAVVSPSTPLAGMYGRHSITPQSYASDTLSPSFASSLHLASPIAPAYPCAHSMVHEKGWLCVRSTILFWQPDPPSLLPTASCGRIIGAHAFSRHETPPDGSAPMGESTEQLTSAESLPLLRVWRYPGAHLTEHAGLV